MYPTGDLNPALENSLSKIAPQTIPTHTHIKKSHFLFKSINKNVFIDEQQNMIYWAITATAIFLLVTLGGFEDFKFL